MLHKALPFVLYIGCLDERESALMIRCASPGQCLASLARGGTGWFPASCLSKRAQIPILCVSQEGISSWQGSSSPSLPHAGGSLEERVRPRKRKGLLINVFLILSIGLILSVSSAITTAAFSSSVIARTPSSQPPSPTSSLPISQSRGRGRGRKEQEPHRRQIVEATQAAPDGLHPWVAITGSS
jgi:hypothetical protein